jgi:YcxB-like protein
MLDFDSYSMDESCRIDVWLRWTFRDVYLAHLWTTLRSGWWLLVPFAALGEAIKLQTRSFGSQSVTHFGLGLLISLGAASLLVLSVPLYMTRNFFRHIPVGGIDACCSFNGTGVKLVSGAVHYQADWSAFLWVRETRSFFLLGSKEGYYWVFPKSCFRRADDKGSFCDLIRMNFPAAKLLAHK